MDILFIHGNYPAQFVHLAERLGQQSQHRVLFLTNREDVESWPLPGVKVRRYVPHRDVSDTTHNYVLPIEGAVLKGQAVVRELLILRSEGFNPRLVLFHGGNGLGLFVRQVFPQVRLVAYLEWWFNDATNIWLQQNYNFNDQMRCQLRNSVILMELDQSDVAVTPTEWQKSQFPFKHQSKIKVIFDGIDTSFFRPGRVEGALVLHKQDAGQELVIQSDARVLSYATRGMEPLRGFPEFMHMLPPLLEEFKDLIVVIAGRDRACYSYQAPGCDGSWKQWMLQELKPKCDLSRIHFTGLLNLGEYRQLFWRTNLHVYFSRSYITSWGLFQAVSCGAPLLVNQDPCIDYVIDSGSVVYCDIDKPDSLVGCAKRSLERTPGDVVRPALDPIYALHGNMVLWQDLVNSI